jgi:hypothetical protein
MGIVIGKLKPICLGTLGTWHLQFVKGRNCEIHIDVGFCLISIQHVRDICARNFIGGGWVGDCGAHTDFV